MIKYGTLVIYKCKNCEHETEIPLHQKGMPRLEKYASYCTHDWVELKEEDLTYASIDKEESRSLQLS